jgi:hypothetical protein
MACHETPLLLRGFLNEHGLDSAALADALAIYTLRDAGMNDRRAALELSVNRRRPWVRWPRRRRHSPQR